MTTPSLTVFFDGACPLCRREIAFYQRLDRVRRIAWHDVAAEPGAVVACGLDPAEALARLHARRPDGAFVSGAAAFVAMWRLLPGFRWVAPMASWPPVLWLLERGYRAFLRLRSRTWRRASA